MVPPDNAQAGKGLANVHLEMLQAIPAAAKNVHAALACLDVRKKPDHEVKWHVKRWNMLPQEAGRPLYAP